MARVVLTQPQPRLAGLARALRARGHEVAECPFSRLEPLEVPGLVERIGSVDWVIAVSPAAIGFLFDALCDDWSSAAGLALVGPGSQRALEARALKRAPPRIVVPDQAPWDASALLRRRPFAAPAGLRCLVVRGEDGREDWIHSLRSAGAAVEVASLYRSATMRPADDQVQLLQAWMRDGHRVHWLFTQTSTLQHSLDLLGGALPDGCGRSDHAWVIHPRIAEAAARLGFASVRVIEPGPEALAAALESA
ncbi:MAG: hypothetical protein RL322_725 [Pseudomonadota bacterium]